MKKALPRKESSKPEPKKAKVGGSTKKVSGKGGKARYSYPGEGGQKTGPGATHPDTPLSADLEKFAQQAGVDPDLVRTVARKFKDKPGVAVGRDKFSAHMSSRFKEFHAKHGLASDYWGRIYDAAMKSIRP